MSKIYLVALAGILTIISAKTVNGAVLYGKFSCGIDLNDATVSMTCGDWADGGVPIDSEGRIYVRGLPDKRICYLTVHHPSYKSSPKVRFSTYNIAVYFNAKIIIREGKIIVLSR